MRYLLICILALGVFGSSPSFAANIDYSKKDNPSTQYEVNRWKKLVERSDKAYEEALIKLSKASERYLPTHIRGLRLVYTSTSFYTPFSEGLVDKMSKYAYAVDTSDDSAVVNKNLQEYRKILNKHIVNMGVLDFAITMAKVNAKFGSATYYEKIRDTIIDGLMPHELDGLAPERAFHIVTQNEELYILAKLGAEVRKSELYDVQGKYYNVYDVILEDGEFTQIFMNVTEPIKKSYIRQHVSEEEKTYTLPGMQ